MLDKLIGIFKEVDQKQKSLEEENQKLLKKIDSLHEELNALQPIDRIFNAQCNAQINIQVKDGKEVHELGLSKELLDMLLKGTNVVVQDNERVFYFKMMRE
jgi:hypothetical protein